jgi:hypothetical protein
MDARAHGDTSGLKTLKFEPRRGRASAPAHPIDLRTDPIDLRADPIDPTAYPIGLCL